MDNYRGHQKRTSISLKPRLEEKADVVLDELWSKHKIRVRLATLLQGLLEMYDEKKHGQALSRALAENRSRDGRTERHQNNPAEQILEDAVKPKKKAAAKHNKKKPDTKAALARDTKRFISK